MAWTKTGEIRVTDSMWMYSAQPIFDIEVDTNPGPTGDITTLRFTQTHNLAEYNIYNAGDIAEFFVYSLSNDIAGVTTPLTLCDVASPVAFVNETLQFSNISSGYGYTVALSAAIPIHLMDFASSHSVGANTENFYIMNTLPGLDPWYIADSAPNPYSANDTVVTIGVNGPVVGNLIRTRSDSAPADFDDMRWIQNSGTFIYYIIDEAGRTTQIEVTVASGGKLLIGGDNKINVTSEGKIITSS